MTVEACHMLTALRSDIPILEGCALRVDLSTHAYPESGQAEATALVFYMFLLPVL